MYVDVAALVPQAMDDTLLTYRLPHGVSAQEALGRRVAIPFGRGNQVLPAFVVRAQPSPSQAYQIKALYGFLDPSPVLSAEMIELGLWMAWRTVCTPYTAFHAMVPGVQTDKIGFEIHVNPSVEGDDLSSSLQKEWDRLQSQAHWDLSGRKPNPAQLALADLGFLRIRPYFREKQRARRPYLYRVAFQDLKEIDEDLIRRAPRQKAILMDLWTNGPQGAGALFKNHGQAQEALKALMAKKLVERFEDGLETVSYEAKDFIKKPVQALNPDQVKAVESIRQHLTPPHFHEFLLYGVTGSGKTEVYIQAIEACLAQGQQAILLVPEIALTMQLVGRLQGALGTGIGVWHSKMTPKDRLKMWEGMKKGQYRVVVGARSAIFAPLPNVGLILIDEAHESSFKQSEPEPRYHAVDVARKRAELEDCPLVLGTATPALKEVQAACEGRIDVVRLPQRVDNRPLPQIHLVDMRSYPSGTLLSPDLLRAIEAAVARGEQAILYLNRRGFAPMVLCQECGQTILCPACDISMTYHQRQGRLRCHYCDRSQPLPKLCPHCQAPALMPYGFGTEQVAQAFESFFPQVPYGRLDADSTRLKGAQQAILGAFSRQETKVLIGTQMLAKGFDFPGVTVCGMVSADLHLNMADYRADELTYQALMQLAGRAGRGQEEGHVYIQSFQPDHPVLQACQAYDSQGFYEASLAQRQALNYPPFVQLGRVVISHPDKEVVRETTRYVARFLHQAAAGSGVDILGPSAAPIERIRGRYRVQFLLKAMDRDQLEKLGHALLEQGDSLRKNKNCRILIDLDPENIL